MSTTSTELQKKVNDVAEAIGAIDSAQLIIDAVIEDGETLLEGATPGHNRLEVFASEVVDPKVSYGARLAAVNLIEALGFWTIENAECSLAAAYVANANYAVKEISLDLGSCFDNFVEVDHVANYEIGLGDEAVAIFAMGTPDDDKFLIHGHSKNGDDFSAAASARSSELIGYLDRVDHATAYSE
jgi:hypothetical protein